jgi:hypothetical protein
MKVRVMYGADVTPATKLDSRTRGVLEDVVVATFVFWSAIFAFGSTYSSTTMTPLVFRAQYFHGVYASRILGRELSLGLYNVLDALGHPNPLSSLAGTGVGYGAMFSAIAIVNYVCLTAFIVLVGLWLRSSRLESAHAGALGLLVALLVGASLYVVTPYDMLSLVLIAATMHVAFVSKHREWLVPVIVIFGCLTRESEFVAVAALVAVAWWCPARVPRRLAVIAAAAGVATYVAVHLAVGTSGSVLQHGLTWYLTRNVHGQLQAYTGVVLVVLAIAMWVIVSGRHIPAGPPQIADLTKVRVTFLVLCTPYLFVAIDSGRWYEGLRLLLPLLVVDLYVRTVEAPEMVATVS